MKKFTIICFLLLFGMGSMMAQRMVKGNITDVDGTALIGANVLVKGTTIGAITDFNGDFMLEVPDGSDMLEVSYIGYSEQDINIAGLSDVTVQMSSGEYLDEVIVTALGISREKKTLGYAATEVKGEEITKVKDANFINSLSGKVAGLDIKRSSTLGGSSNVIIRGSTSLMSSNQALYVVDGTPISNSTGTSSGQNTGRGGYDYGNSGMDINPEDVESITVLKGAAASALYGSRAANGVILVTTKKGTKNAGLGITFSTGYTAGKVDKSTMPVYQKEYGEGYSGFRGWYGNGLGLDYFDFGNGDVLSTPTYEDASFGQKFDPNLMVADWRSYTNQSKGALFPFVAGANDANSFYQTASTYNNSISFDGGNEFGAFRVGYTNYSQTGVVPNSKIERNSVIVAGDYKLSDKFTISSSVNMVLSEGKGRYGTGYDSRNVNQSFRQWYNVGVDIADQKEYYETSEKNETWNPKGPNDPSISGLPNFFDNYYWTAYQNFETDSRTRTMGNIKLDYDLNDWLTLSAKVTTDRFAEIREERIAVGSVDVSQYSRYNKDYSEENLDLYATFNKYFGTNEDFSFNGLLGFNTRRQKVSTIFAETNGGLVTPGVYALSNSLNGIEAPSEVLEKLGERSFIGALNFGYKNFLYVDVTGRNDETSTLPDGNNSYFYPSITGSWIFSEHLGNSSVLDFGKFRMNYAEVGNGTRPNRITTTYNAGTPFNGQPLAANRRTRNNENLVPERTKSFEVGMDLGFWKNRLGLTASYYKANTFNQLIPLQTSGVTGSTFQWKNAGNIENKGFELGVNLIPVQTTNFTWGMNVNWSKNQNKVIELLDDQTNILLADVQGGITINATVGEAYGAIKGSNFVFDDQGRKIVRPLFEGMRYVKSAKPEVIGNVNPDWKAGMTNTFGYKNFSFSFLIDVQHGGDFFSLDTWYGNATGIYENSAGNNRNGVPKRNVPEDGGGVFDDNTVLKTGEDDKGNAISDGTLNTTALYTSDVFSALGYARGPNAVHIYDASYVKLREMSFTYSFPKSMFGDHSIQGIDLSLVGHNLWIISKNSLYSDPEAGLSAGNVQGYQSGVYPSVKEYGFNLTFKF